MNSEQRTVIVGLCGFAVEYVITTYLPTYPPAAAAAAAGQMRVPWTLFLCAHIELLRTAEIIIIIAH